jgi:hypothetical protein
MMLLPVTAMSSVAIAMSGVLVLLLVMFLRSDRLGFVSVKFRQTTFRLHRTWLYVMLRCRLSHKRGIQTVLRI